MRPTMSDGEDETRDSLDEEEFVYNNNVSGDDETNKTPDLDYDMWEGQFEFIGPSENVIPQGLLKTPGSGGSRTKKNFPDVNNKVQILQQQMGVMQDSATHKDERYTRAKAENAALQARIIMLEDQLREAEMRADERIHDEQRRSKELITRLDREKALQLENSSIRLHAAETEAGNYKEEAIRQRVRIEKLENERKELSDQLLDLRHDISTLTEDKLRLKEQERRLTEGNEAQQQLIEELSREVERLRAEARTPALPTTSPEALRLEELHEEMASLREINQQLQESNEELQASILHAGVEQGRKLTADVSLAAELDEMSHDECDFRGDPDSLAKVLTALKEQQDLNAQLREYINKMLLNIVEKCPQLLEVNQRSV